MDNDDQKQSVLDIPSKPDSGLMPNNQVNLDERIKSLKNELGEIKRDRGNLSEMLKQQDAAVASLESTLTPMFIDERTLAGVIKQATINERTVEDQQARRKYEQERWQHMEEYAALEKKKFQTEEELEKQKQRAEDIRKSLQSFEIKEKAQTTVLFLLEFERDTQNLNLEVAESVSRRVVEEKKLDDLKKEREVVLNSLAEIRAKEEKVEQEEDTTEGAVSLAKSREEEHELVKKEFELDKERHETEVSRWGLEDKVSAIGKQVENSESLVKELKAKEEEIKAKLEELNIKKHDLVTPASS